MLKAAFCLLTLSWSIATVAAPPQDSLTYLGPDVGLNLGGSDVLDHNISDGNANTQYIVDAGDGWYFGMHLTQYLWHGPIALRAAVAYDYAGEDPSCLDLERSCLYDMHKTTWDLLLHIDLGDTSSFDLGRTFHRGIVLTSSDDDNRFPQVDFHDAAGWVLQYEHKFSKDPDSYWGIRLTQIMYHTVATGTPANGNSLGMFVGISL
jgi:hypothetical protein